jgi:hypothetical protein
MFAASIVLVALAALLFLGLADRAKRYAAEEEAERAEVNGPLFDPEARTRAFLAASNARGRRINAYRTHNEKSGPRRANDRAA